MKGLAEVQAWLSDDDMRSIYSSAYWNDVEQERKKEFWIEGGDYEKCRQYLQSTKMLDEHFQAQELVEELGRDELEIADLAAGIGWSSSLLSKIDRVATVHSVEISKHRLERLFPHCAAMFDADARKIRRYLGSFYDVRLPSRSIDVVFMSHAFHHADRPAQLLSECDRILKPDGRIIVVGEQPISAGAILRRFTSTLIRSGRLVTEVRRLFPPDPVLGDHYYRHSDYKRMFAAIGYDVARVTAPTGCVTYVADKVV
jgi:ubiquinone/menaquinone biosynthesis C-methylase UbiE